MSTVQEPPTRAEAPEFELDDLPPRPRRRLVTPWTAGLAAVAIAAGGFVGGVAIQKGKGTSSSSSTPAGFPGAAGGFSGAGGPPGSAGADSNAITGTVSYVKGGVIYVKNSDGTTIKVRAASGATVTRSAAAKAGAIHPGDRIVVQGKQSGGTVKATSVTATEAAGNG
jgi:hypothetical protein